MSIQLDDTIVAVSSAAGPAGRAIVRLSGPRSSAIAFTIFRGDVDVDRRAIYAGHVHLSDIVSPVPAELYLFPAPHSVTSQSVAEFHLIASPPLVERLLADLLHAGARVAGPGEFSLRAFLAGKLDLPRAEAVLGVIEAADRNELKQSLRQLAGGVSQPLAGLREDLLNLLADLEAGLDFADEDINFVERPDLLHRLANGLAQVSLVQKQVQDRGISGRPFRIVLAGAANAGKSKLFNALSGSDALVSPVPGTTRDYLVARLNLGGKNIELIDTAGLRSTSDALEARAQQLGRAEVADADLILMCVEPGGQEVQLPSTCADAIRIATKCDLSPVAPGALATSSVTGQGLANLRKMLGEKAAAFAGHGLAPSLSRCRHHVDACIANLRAAHQGVLFNDPAEIVALELRSALEHLGAMTGAVYTDDLLDRIFTRFCIGK
ncbi:MAG: tRNA modification GTPase [Gemmataceae bacterium]